MKKIKKAVGFVWKNNKVWLFITAFTLVVAIAATMAATQNTFISNTISTLLGGERRALVSGDPSKYQYFVADNNDFVYYESGLDYGGKSAKQAKAATLAEANKLNEKIAEEGFVLLKNDAALPLETSAEARTKISVFGKNSVDLVYGGSGSGGGNTKGASTIYDSLTSANYAVNPRLKAFYESDASGSGRGKNPAMGDIPVGISHGETNPALFTTDVKASYKEYDDVALVVLSRIGGEGFDLPRTMKNKDGSAIEGANADDHYLRLDNYEKALLSEVCSAGFGKVVVIVNSSSPMELGFIDDGSFAIDAALWIGSPGFSGVNALGRILSGSVNPSGRLVDTYARNFADDPTWANFSDNFAASGNRYTVGGVVQDAYFIDYEESVYMGYRYYETRGYDEEKTYAEEGWYDENVVYPFGYGLSYTDFAWEIVDRSLPSGSRLAADDEITITVRVRNTGETAGKDVVQLYYSPPYRYGQIEKPIVSLGAFAKTKEIAPAGYDDVRLTVKVADMASYDYNDANNNGFKGYEADYGVYRLIAARNANEAWRDPVTGLAHDFKTDLASSYMIPNTDGFGFTYYDEDTESKVENRFDDVSSHFANASGDKINLLSRSGFDSTLPKPPTAEEREVGLEFIESLKYSVTDKESDPWFKKEEEMPMQGRKPREGETAYKLYDLIQCETEDGKAIPGTSFVDFFDEKWENILDSITIEEMAELIGTGNFHTARVDSVGKPRTTDPDGPAGFTNFMGDPTVYDTCFYASECVIAATWNKDLVHDMGVMIGLEGLWGNVKGDGTPYSGWYAPAVNLHRSPFSGRNFEYYSEDSHLSGMMGASVVAGAKKKGVYTYVKHFAANDQETDRVGSGSAICGLITWADEQALRELYLKPFEMIVKQGKTTAVMSSFNRIGTVWAGGNYALLTEVLRHEWGFKGMVISDYNLYKYMPADQMIRAGGDLNLTQSGMPTTKSEALTATQVSAMRAATKNILYAVAGSNAMNGYGDGVVYRYAMPLWTVGLIILNVALVVAFAVWGFFAIRYKMKKQKARKEDPPSVAAA